MRRLLIAAALVVVLPSPPARAQFVVHDAAVTTRNSVTAVVKEYLLNTQQEQHERLRRMARRLSAHTNLDKFAPRLPPPWRAHRANGAFYAQPFKTALSSGDPIGTAYLDLVHPVAPMLDILRQLPSAARAALTSRLATIDLADATVVAATHDSGRLRRNGYEESNALDALEAHVIDPTQAHSATAVLDKVSGAVLIGARQRQARVQLLAGLVEQLLIDNKRSRDTDATATNMQVVMWRDARAANQAFAAGAGDALRTWRQP